jgi:hypothetical protein
MQLYGNDPDVLLAVRGFLSRLPSCSGLDAHDLADKLYARGYVSCRPHEAAVEAALEALTIDGEVLA